MPITLKDATAKAIAFASEALGADRIKDIRTEEVESVKAESGADAWRITMSMRGEPPSDGPAALSELAALFQARREFKTFTILKDTGEIESMKIRQLA